MRNNRLPLYILIALALVAIIWRIANPPAPPEPGPVGMIPSWKSMLKVGDMGPAAVNPSGTMWAGAWNDDTTVPKTMRSAVLIIDLNNLTSKQVPLGKRTEAAGLSWGGDNTIYVTPSGPGASQRLIKIDARTGSVSTPFRNKAVMSASEMLGEGSAISTHSADDGGRAVAAAFPDKGRSEIYRYCVVAPPGKPQTMFTSADLPGRYENMWVSEAGVLVVVSERTKFHRMFWDSATGKLAELKPGDKTVDVAKTWPDAPKNMMFVAYTGGYDLNLETGKVKRIVSFDDDGKNSSYWRLQVQNGRLYPRKDGGYTSVSYAANEVDIRVINKDGTKGRDILPRR